MNDAGANDRFGAYVPGTEVKVAGAATGPLAGLGVAVKDLYDIAGHRTGCGNPDWLRTHGPATRHAWAVQALLDAGAHVTGKTITVELAFGLSGDNIHYGMPINPAAPDRVPGGSSCGSAAAVAGRLADVALGTDTGGSVRIPASYCGIYGMRPTHGRIPLDGIMPLSPGFDTVGHFARDAVLFERVGRVLLREGGEPPRPRRLLWAEDSSAFADPSTVAAAMPLVEKIAARVGKLEKTKICPTSPEDWGRDRRTLAEYECWQTHGAWIEATKPKMGDDVAERFRGSSKVTAVEYAAATARQKIALDHMERLLSGGAVLCQPTSPCPPPPRDRKDLHQVVRTRSQPLLGTSGLTGIPEITIPAGRVDDAPVGLSLLGARGSDAMLLRLAAEIAG
jgi:amidase